jgi:hypothetical protein
VPRHNLVERLALTGLARRNDGAVIEPFESGR